MGKIGKSFPNGPFKTFQETFDYLNRAHWNLTVVEADGRLNLYGGDQCLFQADSNQELESFVLGMGLTFWLVGPEELPGFEPWK